MKTCLEPDFYSRVLDISKNLGTDPNNLLAVMSFETGGTFSPSTKNTVNNKATGLIQFMPSTAESLGTTTDELSKMSATDQLSFVEAYLSPFKGNLKKLSDLYMAVFMPKFIKATEETMVALEGTDAYSQNKGLDVNKDGAITKLEVTQKVQTHLERVKSMTVCR
jgi:hypothetical protein